MINAREGKIVPRVFIGGRHLGGGEELESCLPQPA